MRKKVNNLSQMDGVTKLNCATGEPIAVEPIAVRTFSCSNILKHVFSILSYVNTVNIAR